MKNIILVIGWVGFALMVANGIALKHDNDSYKSATSMLHGQIISYKAEMAQNSVDAIKQCETRMSAYKISTCNPQISRAFEDGINAGVCATSNEYTGQSVEVCLNNLK